MIHAYLGIVQTTHPDDERIGVMEPHIDFFGDPEGIKFWSKEIETATKKFPKVDWFEKDVVLRKQMIKDQFNAFVQFFAEKGFKPAGESTNQRIFYFDGK